MPPFERGVYELLVTEAVASELGKLAGELEPRQTELRSAEAPDRIALHLGRVLHRALESLPDEARVAAAVALARDLLVQIASAVPASEARAEAPREPAEVLRFVAARQPDGRAESIPVPLIPLLDTTLLTNAPGEPRVGKQIETEIHSADRIDVVMAFIRRSGIAPLLEALRSHCHAGRALRMLTTTYTGSTEAAALDALREIGADVRVSYDTDSTRLHAKAWLFHRRSGFSTAYIGSSNLTHSAQTSGLEWNVRVSGARNRDVIGKMDAVFESYWNSGDFVPYDRAEFLARAQADAAGPTVILSPIEIRLEPFQERLLEQIALARQRGHHRNLLVAATGTGKTVMAAVDYSRLRETLPRARLLFVAHREEILDQSLATFRHCLREHAFGERWVGGDRPTQFDHVFASIQSLNASGVEKIDPAHFDVVIVDEFHHAAAPSYRALLERVRPAELLGLTATPERSDGLPVLEWFDNRIAAELRLWDAIDQHRLSPFVYYGIHDGLDLREIPWVRGRGYDVEGLSKLFTATDAWARKVIAELGKHVDSVSRIRALGFCVSVEHARYMARVFNEAGIRSTAVWADSPDEERRAALADLAARRINVVFSVDLFNEGVDVPAVDTLLLLRPTDSPTLFLQQLGRGLRRAVGKTVCTVLDFVGRHRSEFRFDRRFRALLGGSRQDVAQQVETGFPFLPAGCHMELDRVARDIVLQNIRDAVPSRWTAKVEELRQLARPRSGHHAGRLSRPDRPGARGRLRRQPIVERPPERRRASASVSRASRSGPASRMRTNAPRRRRGPHRGVPEPAVDGPKRPQPSRSPSGIDGSCACSSALWPTRSFGRSTSLDEGAAAPVGAPASPCRDPRSPRRARDSTGARDSGPFDTPRRPSADSRALLAHRDPGSVRSRKGRERPCGRLADRRLLGPKAKADLFAFTLDKTTGHFSPTTRYRDYAISRDLIHWQSQSVTRADSDTGRRYQQHKELGTSVMLFARLRTDDRAFSFLGPATT